MRRNHLRETPRDNTSAHARVRDTPYRAIKSDYSACSRRLRIPLLKNYMYRRTQTTAPHRTITHDMIRQDAGGVIHVSGLRIVC